MAFELFGQLRIDADSEEISLAVRQRLFERALNGIGTYRDAVDLALIEQTLELAVRYGFDLRVACPIGLNKQHADNGGYDIPEHYLALALTWVSFFGHNSSSYAISQDRLITALICRKRMIDL